jgi:DNA-binding CsgD family transcriptional regulator
MANAEVPISEREIEVLQLVATGATNQEIARELTISVNTVKVHMRNIFEKLDVQSRTEATLYAIRQGWVMVDGVETGVAEPSDETMTLPPVPTGLREPLMWWQRAYALAALSLALALLFVPILQREDRIVARANPISDRPAAGYDALVDDEPGITRDRLYAHIHWEDTPLTIIDTGGLDDPPGPVVHLNPRLHPI